MSGAMRVAARRARAPGMLAAAVAVAVAVAVARHAPGLPARRAARGERR